LGAGSPEAIREAGRLCAVLAEQTAEAREHLEHVVLRTAFALEELGDTEDAARFYAQVMNCEFADPAARASASCRYGLLQELAGRTSESTSAFQLTVDLASDPLISQVARRQLAVLLLREGRFAQALLHLNVLLADPELEAGQRLPYELRRLRVLLKLNGPGALQDDCLQLLPPSGSTVDEAAIAPWMEVAMDLEFALKYELARDFYLRLQEVRGIPARVRTDCHFRAGLMFEHLSQWESSVRHYRIAVDAPPDFPEAQALARFRLAELMYLSEDYDAAMEHLAVLSGLPELDTQQRLEAKFRYAVCLFRRGQLDEAVTVLRSCREQVRERDNGFGSRIDLCLAEIFERRSEVEAACREYERIIANAYSEPVVKSSALARLHQLRHKPKRFRLGAARRNRVGA